MIKLLRSPFWSILAIVTITVLMVIKLELPNLPAWFEPVAVGVLCVNVLFILIWVVAAWIYNRQHPGNKVNWSGLYPVEFREEDEGMRWLTYRACRRVYMFFYISLPLALMTLFLFPEQRSLPLLLIAALAIAQYLIYWSVIRKADIKEDEE